MFAAMVRGQVIAAQTYCDVGLERGPDVTVVTVTGEVDLFTAPTLVAALEQALEWSAPIVVDLSDCSFFESSGLNALLATQLRGAADCPPIVVVRPPRSCADRTLSLTVPGHFPEHDSRAAAVASVARAAR